MSLGYTIEGSCTRTNSFKYTGSFSYCIWDHLIISQLRGEQIGLSEESNERKRLQSTLDK